MKATDIIRRDHEAAKELFEEYRNADEEGRKDLDGKIFDALSAHEKMEDDYFYPALKELIGEDAFFQELDDEQSELERGVLALKATAFLDRREKMLETFDKVIAHATKEETELLPRAEELLSEDALEDLGAKMEAKSAVAKSE